MLNRILFGLAFMVSAGAHAEIKGLVCTGTEPFFSVNIDVQSKKLTYSAPENVKGTIFSVTDPLQAQGLQKAKVMVFKDQRSDMTATVISDSIAGACSDGMSENQYAYHLVFTKGNSVKYGCCEPKAQD
jgi:uncharacterized membrane protein